MRKLFVQFVIFMALLSIPLAVMAAGNNLLAQVQIDPTLKPQFAPSIESTSGDRTAPVNIVLQLIAGSLIYAAGPIAVLMIAIGGLRYVTSRGDQNAMEEAKKTILWAVIGLVVIILSFAIVTNVISVLNIPTAPANPPASTQQATP